MSSIAHKLTQTDNFSSGSRLYVEPWNDTDREEHEVKYHLVEINSEYIVYDSLIGYENHDHVEVKRVV